jgi:hypothetical protein
MIVLSVGYEGPLLEKSNSVKARYIVSHRLEKQ